MISLLDQLKTAPTLPARKNALAVIKSLMPQLLQDDRLYTYLNTPFCADLVSGFLTYSPYLTSLLRRYPDWLFPLLTSDPHQFVHSLIDGLKSQQQCEKPHLMTELRQFHSHIALLTALADCGGVWSIDKVTQVLSQAADAGLRTALQHVLREAAYQGKIHLPDLNNPEQDCGLVILAMGKHGANELNYSSDIDLVVLFDPNSPAFVQTSEPATLCVKMAQNLARLLQESTRDGFVHRVDYRLRPDPGSTAIAISLPAAFSYYESVGQNWERAAMIKARPVAGDVPLGETFLQELRPFIWRKYFDFAAIADIHAMKRQIHAVRGFEDIAVEGHNIKLGRGGIREIEFFVQTQQLVYGGRRPLLRGAKTLDMLQALFSENWISENALSDLSEAYRFLRMVEHRLQMINDEQTQRIPQDKIAVDHLSRFCGFKNRAGFAKALIKHAKRVQHHYSLLFEEGEELAIESGNLVFTGIADDPETLETLAKMGFPDPPLTAETVRGWHFGRRPAITSARAREVLTELAPLLLQALGQTADPQGALGALDAAFGRMPAAVELMTMLLNNKRLLTLFADCLGTAPRMAETIGQSPHVLDAVIDPAFTDISTDEDKIETQVRHQLGRPETYEDFLDRLRDITRQMRFVTGARILSGVLTPTAAGEFYAAIARAAIILSIEHVTHDFMRDHGRIKNGRFAVLGLGRLGTREMTASSDLDLVVVYDFEEDARTSSGTKKLDATLYYTRLTQRLVAALTVPTRRGRLYEVDLRLRPSGGKGPLASQFKGFISYQSQEAELWEHLALTRARVLWASPNFAKEVERAIDHIISEPRDPKLVVSSVKSMRNLIAQEKGDQDVWDMKNASGAMTDIDFFAQSLLLVHGHILSDLTGLGTLAVLSECTERGLLNDKDAWELIEAYSMFTDIFQWQRLTIRGNFDGDKTPKPILKRLATVADVPNVQLLKSTLVDRRSSIVHLLGRLYQDLQHTKQHDRLL